MDTGQCELDQTKQSSCLHPSASSKPSTAQTVVSVCPGCPSRGTEDRWDGERYSAPGRPPRRPLLATETTLTRGTQLDLLPLLCPPWVSCCSGWSPPVGYYPAGPPPRLRIGNFPVLLKLKRTDTNLRNLTCPFQKTRHVAACYRNPRNTVISTHLIQIRESLIVSNHVSDFLIRFINLKLFFPSKH